MDANTVDRMMVAGQRPEISQRYLTSVEQFLALAEPGFGTGLGFG